MNKDIKVYSPPRMETTFETSIPYFYSPSFGISFERTYVIDELMKKKLKFLMQIAKPSMLMAQYLVKINVRAIALQEIEMRPLRNFVPCISNGAQFRCPLRKLIFLCWLGKWLCKKIRRFEKENNMLRKVFILFSWNDNSMDISELLDKQSLIKRAPS